MANLKVGTTVGGQSVVHAGNLSDHGILSTSSSGSISSLNGAVLTITKSGSAPGNNTALLVTNTYANHSWGIVGEFRIDGNSGTDKPAILFSSGQTTTSWAVGYKETSSNFGIAVNRGYRNGGWGSNLMEMDPSGNVTFTGNITAGGNMYAPRYYDSNDTGYFLDPAGTSYLNDLRVNVIYDRNNTGYYVDPASTSSLNTVYTNTGYTTNVRGDYYYQQAHGNPRNNLGDPTVTEMALFNEQFNNKTAFYDPSKVTVWQQPNNGDEWQDITANYSQDAIRKFIAGYDTTSNIFIPNGVYAFRIEVSAVSYVFLNALYIYWSSNSHSTKVHVWVRRVSNGEWLQHTSSSTDVSSWPGHLYLPFSTVAFLPGPHTSTGHRDIIRFEFIPNWSTGTYADRNIDLYKMQIWGGYPSGTRYPYTVNEYGDFTARRDVYANKLIDKDNTGYYLDPSGSSVLRRIYADDNIYVTALYDYNDNNYYVNPAGMSNVSEIQINGTSSFFTGQTSQLSVENIGTFARFAFNKLDFYDWGYGSILTIDNSLISSPGTIQAGRLQVDGGDNYIDTVSSYLHLASMGNEIVVGGHTDMYVNYRQSPEGTPTTWYWKAGSSSSWATMNFGAVNANGNISATGTVSASGGNSSNWNTAYSWGNHAGLYASASHTHNYLTAATGSEQQVDLRYAKWNQGGRTMNTDPRWNESGYDGDLGCLHIWSHTAAGASYGRAGIALYNGGAYQYLTTKGGATGLYVNNQEIIHAGIIGNQSVNYASSAGAVAWNNVSGKPTNLSSFTNDSGYVTGSHSHTASNVHSWIYATGGDANNYTTFGIYRNYAVNGPIGGHNTIFNVAQSDGNYGFQLGADTTSSADGLYYRSKDTTVGTWKQVASRDWVAGRGYLTSVPAQSWSSITGKPTTVSGYGITDAITTSNIASQSVNYAVSASSAGSVTINYGNNSNSTYQMLWGSGNNIYATSEVYVNPYTDYVYANSFNASDWFRSSGSTGWYNQSYGGGIYMQDGTWVRVYNNKQFLAENLIQSNTAMYAPVFYDSANNGYYLDPNGGSNLDTITVQSTNTKVLKFTGVGTDSGNGSAPTDYGIYQQGGAWTYPYPDLCIGYHTGIKIGAHYNYGGTRFFNNSDWATEIFSVGNGDSNVRVTNNLYIGSAGGWITDLLNGKQAAGSYAAASHTHDDRYYTESESDSRFVLNSSRGQIGNSTVSVGSTAGWPMNPIGGTYTTSYSGHGGTVIMSADVGGSAGSIGMEFTYNGQFYYHSNTDSNRWTSHQVWTSANFANNSTQWNTAYGWGNHASAGYLTSLPAHNHDGVYLPIGGKAADANLLDGLDLHTGRNNEANKVVRTDSNGYIQAGWINTPSGATTSTLTKIYASQDDYIRYVTPAEFRRQITDGVYQPAGSYATAAQGAKADTALQSLPTHGHAWTEITGKPTNLSSFTNDLGNYGGFLTSVPAQTWSSITGKPGAWMTSDNLIYGNAPDTIQPSGFYESYLGSGNPTGTWFNYVNVRHSNTSNGHGFQIGMSYYDTNLWFRSYQGGLSPTYSSWSYAIHSNNIGSQSVNYATTAGTANAVAWGNVSGKPSTFAPSAHTHAISEVTGLQTALDGKASSSHTHSYLPLSGGTLSGSLSVTGNITATGDVTAYSDERLKSDIEVIENPLDKVLGMRGVTFRKNNEETRSVGVIAQEVLAVIPEAVKEDENGMYSVAYGNLVGVLIEAIKEQQIQINELSAKLNGL